MVQKCADEANDARGKPTRDPPRRAPTEYVLVTHFLISAIQLTGWSSVRPTSCLCVCVSVRSGRDPQDPAPEGRIILTHHNSHTTVPWVFSGSAQYPINLCRSHTPPFSHCPDQALHICMMHSRLSARLNVGLPVCLTAPLHEFTILGANQAACVP